MADPDDAPEGRLASASLPPQVGPISVVVPTFNDVGRIGDALESITSQTLPPAEIIVSDDGSNDGTEQFVLQFAQSPRAGKVAVRYVRLPSRAGVVAARNHGISVARGEWIAECDSDDMWASTKLEQQVNFIHGWRGRRRIALLGTYGHNMNDARKVISPAVMGPTTEAEYEAVRRRGGLFFVIHSSVLFRRSDFTAVGGYSTEYGAADEFDFFCRMAERGVVINLPVPLVFYRKRTGSMQLDQFWDKEQGALRVAENQRRRAAGRPPIGREAFAAQLAQAPARVRFRRRRQALGMYHYRAGAAHAVNGRRIRGGLQLLLASLMDVALVRAGLRNVARSRIQRVSRASKKALLRD
jgi:glycosyltransferase involved in cell wall biosynthesis